MLSTFIPILIILLCFFDFIGSVEYELCNDAKVFCIEVVSSTCSNCDGGSLQNVINGLDASGNYTIYLVGDGSTSSDLVESVIISSASTPEDIYIANEIKPYPGHSIVWKNSDDNFILDIDVYWWKITGDGGYLRFENPSTTSASKEMISVAYGAILTNFEVRNVFFGLSKMIFVSTCNFASFKAFLLEGLNITGVFSTMGIMTNCYCGELCSSNSFVDKYGENNRLLIRKNHFEHVTNYYISGYPISYTIESNYFRVIGTLLKFLRFTWNWAGASDGANVYNNIFHIPLGAAASNIVNCNYEDVGDYGGKFLFFNNHIIDESSSGSLDSLFHYVREKPEDGSYVPDPFFVYNNLIDNPKNCTPIVQCTSTDFVANMFFQYNHQTNPECSDSWNSSFSSCDQAASKLENLGRNSVGSVSLIKEGDIPFPYFDLAKEFYGMPYPNSTLVLPGHDYAGRARPNDCQIVEWRNGTSIGAFEYYKRDRQNFPLCDDDKVFCVEVNSSYGCCNCDSTTIQEIVDKAEMSSGGYTIYLVGKSGSNVSFEESVVIDVSTPENILLANVIQPYPDHSIIWRNSGDNENLVIKQFWWKITGDGGYLRLENPNTVSQTKKMIKVSYGAVLTNFVVFNWEDDLDEMIYISDCDYADYKGTLIERLTFHGFSGNRVIYVTCYCFTCSPTSFTDEYGVDNRILIRKNHFEKEADCFIKLGKMAGSIENNYFKSTERIDQFLIFFWNQLPLGIRVFNNVFEIPSGATANVIILQFYRTFSTGKILFFNNLIIDETGQVDSLFLYNRFMSVDKSDLPDPFYIYNNLVISPSKCVPFVKCSNAESVSNVLFQYNHQTKQDCGGNWNSTFSTCNTTASQLINLGNNTVGPVDFAEIGDVPYPYYDLDQFLDGMPYPTSPPYVLPDEDFEGRARPSNCKLSTNKTSIGAFEYYHGRTTFPLCDDDKVFCVEVNSSFQCCNCDSRTIQEVVDQAEMSSGGYTIFLVGKPGIDVSFEENVVIDISTPEDISLENVIQPYPGHSIIWRNSGDNANLVIKQFWWKITGDGGYLRLENPNTVSGSKNMINVSYGAVLTNFVITNFKSALLRMMIFVTCELSDFKGFLLEGVSFFGVKSKRALQTMCYCKGACIPTSFVDKYGESSRMLIRKNVFEKEVSETFILANPLAGTVESNYFKPIVKVNRFITFYWHDSLDGVSFFNNVFEVKSGVTAGSIETAIFIFYYQKIGNLNTYGKNLVYNNLIIDETGELTSLFLFYRLQAGDSNSIPDPVYIYNNMIQSSSKCAEFVKCDIDSVLNVYFMHNHQSKSGCSDSWDNRYNAHCNVTAANFVDWGSNTAGPVDFVEIGDVPYPYYDIEQYLDGMPYPNDTFALPDHDYVGRPRPFCKISQNKTTIGAFEYVNGRKNYSLCDQVNVYCVEVNASFSCCNCDSRTIQGVVDRLDASGGYTIYLVGDPGVGVSFEESVVISSVSVTPENISLANIIQPYPGHSIIWQNSGDKANVDINTFWWKITGDGGTLKLENPNTLTASIPMVEVSYGAILTNFELKSELSGLDKMINILQCDGGNFKGFLFERLVFTGFPISDYSIRSFCFCGSSCPSTSFVDNYGVDNRLLIRRNRFEKRTASGYISGYTSMTVESNYFKVVDTLDTILWFSVSSATDGVTVYNNIVHVLPSVLGKYVVKYYYEKEGDVPSYGKNLFFNNHVIVEGSMTSLFRYSRWDDTDEGALPDPFYVYNNLIVDSNACASIVDCATNDESVVNLYFQYNHQTKPGCSDSWDDKLSSCNVTASKLVNLGNNEAGPAFFVGVGEKPFPYYKITADLVGMAFDENLIPPYVLPTDDYLGTSRPGPDTLKRTTIGAIEYVCPSQCLVGGKVSCQNSSDCGCVSPYFGTYSCQFSECDCFRGNCSSPDPLTGKHICTCDEHYFGEICNITKCYGIYNNDTSVCNGHGKCKVQNNCTCYQNYTLFPGNYDPETDLSGEDVCSHWNCFGTYRFDESVCHGHGNCSDSNICDCGKNYNSTSDCGSWKCFGEDRDDLEKVCSGHGVCASFDKCVCSTTDYTGGKCNVFTCHNISRESDDACGVYGTCTDIDKCKCNPGYSSSSDNSPCDSWSCFLVNKDIKTSVCSNRGTCDAPNQCTCKNNFEGDNCETFSCGFDHKNAATCSGHGKCTDPEICDCDFGYSGVLCQTNDMYLTIMTPALATTGFIFGIFLFICMVCVLCVLCICMALICVAMLAVGGLYTTNRIQKLRMRKFSKLRNVDLILREQELDDDVSIAHLRINRNLFEISFDEIKTERILGEGGSNSVVFKANWNGLIVAFKCFKTRQLMSNQDKFDEFEREVEILSSLAHPNIIRFFGATMKPPRIGIVMEYASNGEMLEYMNKFKEMSGSSYPIFQKIRMFSQVAKAMDFLHCRNIIHRDLKSENVLIDSEETCKLMDFGLSRLVDRMSVAKTSRVGTDCYMAPEIVTSSNYSEKCDVYSFSILMFIVLTEDPRPYGWDAFQVEIKAANNSSYRPAMSKLDFIDSKKFGWLKKMIIKCWSHTPDERDSFKKLREKLDQGGGEEEEFDEDTPSFSGGSGGGYENLSKFESVRLLKEKDEELEKLREEVRRMKEKYEDSDKSGEESSEDSEESEESFSDDQ